MRKKIIDLLYAENVRSDCGIERLADEICAIDAVEVVRCNQCKHYEGVHGVSGNAPCAFWGIGAVMWDDFCKRGEQYDTD